MFWTRRVTDIKRPFDVIFSPIMLSSLISNSDRITYCSKEWRGASEKSGWYSPQRCWWQSVRAGRGNENASSIWLPSTPLSHQWQPSLHHLSLPYLPSLDLNLLFSSLVCWHSGYVGGKAEGQTSAVLTFEKASQVTTLLFFSPHLIRTSDLRRGSNIVMKPHSAAW